MKPIALSIVLLLSSYAAADTIHFQRGHWNGTVTYNGVNFIVESEGKQYTYGPSQIKQIEFNDITTNPPVPVCPLWKRLLLFYSDCGLYDILGGLFGVERPDKPKYRTAKPPKVRAALAPDASAAEGTPARLEFTDKRKPLACVLLRMNPTELKIHTTPGSTPSVVNREEVRVLFPQRRPSGKGVGR